MKIEFRTKNEANEAQQKDFLALEPIERIYSFLNLIQQTNRFPTKATKSANNNFIINL